jgi:hypothetical protein
MLPLVMGSYVFTQWALTVRMFVREESINFRKEKSFCMNLQVVGYTFIVGFLPFRKLCGMSFFDYCKYIFLLKHEGKR